MASATNPFHTLYLTEGVGEVHIPAVFSPVLVPFVGPLFLPGNVMLKGMQGTGKTMLLSLLETNVRLAFWNDAQNPDPLTGKRCRFVGAGINLSKSNASKLNEIVVSADRDENIGLSKAYFGDYVNCWVLRDLLASIKTLITKAKPAQLDEIGVTKDLRRLDRAVKKLALHSTCSFLIGCKTVEDARKNLEFRCRAYLQLVSNPKKMISKEVDRTRCLLGEPLSAATEILRETGVIEDDTSVFVTIDQFEWLLRKKHDGDDEKHRRFVDAIDELIGSRERAVSYRIGARPNATLEKSESGRDYHEVNLDAILQRKEHDDPRGVFPRFAEEAFRRRIAVSGIPHAASIVAEAHPIKFVFGDSPKYPERARSSAPKKRERILRLERSWSAKIRDFLTNLAKTDVLSAKLGEAWIRQRLAKSETVDVAELKQLPKPPWESRRWWKKERLPLSVLQIAAANAQRVEYSGEGDIVALSGENILAFIAICREIWECVIRHDAEVGSSDTGIAFHRIAPKRQAEGIRDASDKWHSKTKEHPDGDDIQRLMDVIGNKLHQQLIEDRQMSYPGANGFSLALHDLRTDPEVERLLDDAVAECYLLRREHTPKNLARGESAKWYPHPVLAPFYGLTVPHTKEPLYLRVSKLRQWLEGRVVVETQKPAKRRSESRKDIAVDKTDDSLPDHEARPQIRKRRGPTVVQKTFGFDEDV